MLQEAEKRFQGITGSAVGVVIWNSDSGWLEEVDLSRRAGELDQPQSDLEGGESSTADPWQDSSSFSRQLSCN